MIKLKYRLNEEDAIRIKESYKHVSETFSKIDFDFMLAGIENVPNISKKVNEDIVIARMKNVEAYKPSLELAINRFSKKNSIVMTTNRANYLEGKDKEIKDETFIHSFIKITLLALGKKNDGFAIFIDFGSQRYPYFFNFPIGGNTKEDGTLQKYLTYFSGFDDALRLPLYRQIKKNKESIQINYGQYFEQNIEKLFSVKIPKLEEIKDFDFTREKKIAFVDEINRKKSREKYCTLIYSPFPEEITFDIKDNGNLTLWVLSKKMSDEAIKKMFLETDCLNLWFKILYKEYLYGKNIISKFKSEILLEY